MTALLAVVTLLHESGLPIDSDVNTFVFTSTETDPVVMADNLDGAGTTGALQRFYNHAAGANSIADHLSSVIHRGDDTCTIEYYDITGHLDGSDHGSPVKVTNWSMTAASADHNDTPAECGVVMTILGAGRATAPVVSGGTHPKARHTGRVYLGPTNNGCWDLLSGEVRVAENVQLDITAAGSQLLTDVAGIATATLWVVWSRAGNSVDTVVGGFVDNAPDIQRRRGVASTNRVTFT